MLEGFDEEARKFLEAGTGGLHTKERCQEAKLKLEAKNDHGNELVHDTTKTESPKEMYQRLAGNTSGDLIKGYVDHTVAKGQQKVKFFIGTAEEVETEYNDFRWVTQGKINVFGTQLAVDTGIIYFSLNYEETAK